MKKILAILVVSCIMVTMLSSITVDTYEASEKAGNSLLETLNVTYNELVSGNFNDSGKTYSCMIWIEDVELETAVEMGLEAAELTRESGVSNVQLECSYDVYEYYGAKYIDVKIDECESDEYVQTYIDNERMTAKQLYMDKNNAFIAQNFMARDMSICYVSQYSPCILADLTISRIAELIQLDVVMLIEYCGELQYIPATEQYINSSTTGPTLNSNEIAEILDIVDIKEAKSKYGLTGEGIKIGEIDSACPDDSSVNKNENGDNTKVNGEEYSHADDVHLILSTIASGAEFYATGMYEENNSNELGDFMSHVEWLISQGVNIINHSAVFHVVQNGEVVNYNTYDTLTRWVDHITYNHDVHFVQAAGNDGVEGVGAPGMAYNAITVGSTEKDISTFVSSYSSFNLECANRSEQLTYKPDFVAPSEYSDGVAGTSLSAPVVAGAVALLCEYRPGFKTRQFLAKAVLAASTGKETICCVTDHATFMMAGAGMIDMDSAVILVAQGKCSYTTSNLSTVGSVKTYDMEVGASDTCMRIALAYGNRIEYSSSSHSSANVPNCTIGVLEIAVKTPSGQYVEGIELDDANDGANLKVIEFDPREYGTGTYTIEIRMKAAHSNGKAISFCVAWR